MQAVSEELSEVTAQLVAVQREHSNLAVEFELAKQR